MCVYVCNVSHISRAQASVDSTMTATFPRQRCSASGFAIRWLWLCVSACPCFSTSDVPLTTSLPFSMSSRYQPSPHSPTLLLVYSLP